MISQSASAAAIVGDSRVHWPASTGRTGAWPAWRPENLLAIAFCVDVAHAHEVQQRLVQHLLRAEVLTGRAAGGLRSDARGRLDTGEVQVLCVVDIYNEGVDVPNVNTLFFFRPTESATVFLQQLGRGLRRAPGKAELVVFDLTGRQHHSFRFDRKLPGALGHTPKELEKFVATGFGRLDAGMENPANELMVGRGLNAAPKQRTKPAKMGTQPMNWRAIMAPSAFADGDRRLAAMGGRLGGSATPPWPAGSCGRPAAAGAVAAAAARRDGREVPAASGS